MSRGVESLVGVVAPEVLLDAIETSQKLTHLGVPHVLIGGLAVGLHGHPRATKDVDFLVGPEAFERTSPFLIYREELKDIARVGVIDLMAVPAAFPYLSEFLAVPQDDAIPLLSVEALVMLKLDAGRAQDLADVLALIAAGAQPDNLIAYLRQHAAHLITRLTAILE